MTAISPELALIDPELAAAARALLPDPGRFCPRYAQPELAHPPTHLTPRPPTIETRPVVPATPRPRRHNRPRIVAAAAALCTAATAAAALELIGHVLWQPAAPASPTPVSRAALQARAARQVRDARIYTWPVVPGAVSYQIEIHQGAQSIFQATTTKPALALPAGLQLTPGRYTWTATPKLKNPSPDTATRPVVEETFTIQAD